MIVKHENRIRTLEARAAEDATDTAKDNGDSLIITNSDQNDVDTKDVNVNDDD